MSRKGWEAKQSKEWSGVKSIHVDTGSKQIYVRYSSVSDVSWVLKWNVHY